MRTWNGHDDGEAPLWFKVFLVFMMVILFALGTMGCSKSFLVPSPLTTWVDEHKEAWVCMAITQFNPLSNSYEEYGILVEKKYLYSYNGGNVKTLDLGYCAPESVR